MLPFVCASVACLSSQPWTDTHRWIGIHIQYIRAEACVRARALVCVRGRARIRADACEHFTPPPSVALIGSQAFNSASAFNANIGAWNTASVTTLYSVCAASGPARTAADRARSVADACAAVVRGGAADVFVCARARM